MAEAGTKFRLLEYLKELSGSVEWDELSKYTAQTMAEQLKMSRTLVSQYLNEAVTTHEVVKVNSRPVYFFHGDILSKYRKNEPIESIYDSVEELQGLVESARSKVSVFDSLIGATGSLSYNVEQCKAAVSYPGNGLPILLLGATGTGKSYLASLMYDYALAKGILEPNKVFVSVNCAEYANNPEFFLTHLFGHKRGAYTGADKDHKGLLAQADGGMLFLDEVHCLSSQCQEKLFHFMDKGTYHMVGDNEKWYRAQVHIVMATTEDPKLSLLGTMLRRIPIITRIPSLTERGIKEKKELLLALFKNEEHKVKRQITLSSMVYRCLVEYEFEGNVGQLENCVRASVANAYLDGANSKTSDLPIFIQHLPDYLLSGNLVHISEAEDKNMLRLPDITRELHHKNKLYMYNRDILLQYNKMSEEGCGREDFLTASKTRFEQYLDDLLLEAGSEENPREALYMDIITGICTSLGKHRGIEFLNQDILNISHLVCDYMINGSGNEGLLHKHYNNIQSLQELLSKKDSGNNNQIVMELAKEIAVSLGKTLDPLFLLDLYICVDSFSGRFHQKQIVGVILAHGYSTASSMAATANHMLGDHLFDAIDMPVDVKTAVIAQKLSGYVRSYGSLKDIILLVDMGSLEDIYKSVENISQINVGVIGDVTMKLILSVGTQILNKIPIQSILEKQKMNLTHHECILLENRKKPNAILSVCATGMGTAEKISDLLKQSFPETLDIQVVPYNYNSLAKAGNQSPIFEKYNILFIVGTHDPRVEGCSFLSLEDIIQQQNAGEIDRIMMTILTREELKRFNDNLIKKFSLTNLVGHLTILNPEKVIEFAEEIIKLLQQKTGETFKNRTVVGLYIHICCLVERLITDRYIVNYEDIGTLERDHKDFIRIVQEAFKGVEKYYGVGIPAAEIGYLYEYIYNM